MLTTPRPRLLAAPLLLAAACASTLADREGYGTARTRAASPVAPTHAEVDEDRCVEWTPTGSHISRMRCEEPERVELRRERDREAVRRAQINRGRIPGGTDR